MGGSSGLDFGIIRYQWTGLSPRGRAAITLK